jgi:hypothetical protein
VGLVRARLVAELQGCELVIVSADSLRFLREGDCVCVANESEDMGIVNMRSLHVIVVIVCAAGAYFGARIL